MVPRTADAVVGTLDIAPRLSVAKVHKGTGPNMQPNELARVASVQLSRVYDPLIIKATLNLLFPL